MIFYLFFHVFIVRIRFLDFQVNPGRVWRYSEIVGNSPVDVAPKQQEQQSKRYVVKFNVTYSEDINLKVDTHRSEAKI